jgi:hypothetical protein
MTYILYVWTVVGLVGSHHGIGGQAMDWRANGIYESSTFNTEGYVDGRDKCEQAARQLGLKSDKYRCVRSK